MTFKVMILGLGMVVLASACKAPSRSALPAPGITAVTNCETAVDVAIAEVRRKQVKAFEVVSCWVTNGMWWVHIAGLPGAPGNHGTFVIRTNGTIAEHIRGL